MVIHSYRWKNADVPELFVESKYFWNNGFPTRVSTRMTCNIYIPQTPSDHFPNHITASFSHGAITLREWCCYKVPPHPAFEVSTFH